RSIPAMNILIRCAIAASLLSFLLVSATPGPSDAVVPHSESGPTRSITDVINFSDGAMLPPWEEEAGFHDLVARAGGGLLGKLDGNDKKERPPAEEILEFLYKLEKDLDQDQSILSGSKEKKKLEKRIVGDLNRLPILIGRLYSAQSPILTEEKKKEIGLRLVNGIAKAKTNVATWPPLDQTKYDAK
ncbi:hypothetical protein H0H93_015288, partial [Arthromyces matolae]